MDIGFSDVIIGTPGERISSRNNAGAVHVLYGTNNGTTTANDTFLYLLEATQATAWSQVGHFTMRLAMFRFCLLIKLNIADGAFVLPVPVGAVRHH